LGYEWQILADLRLATDVYFQYQFSVPVAALNNRTFGGLNVSEFQFNMPVLVSQGTGMGYGWTFTLEKFFTRKYYLLFTGSVFRNQYRDIDGRVHPTVDDRRFAFNLPGGKEFYLGKNKNHILSLNVRINVTGGVRYTPLDQAESELRNEAVYDYSRVNTAQAAPFFAQTFVSITANRAAEANSIVGLTFKMSPTMPTLAGWVGTNKNVRKQRFSNPAYCPISLSALGSNTAVITSVLLLLFGYSCLGKPKGNGTVGFMPFSIIVVLLRGLLVHRDVPAQPQPN